MTNNPFAKALQSHMPAPQASPPTPSPSPKKKSAKRKHIGGYFDPEVARSLRMLASEEETTVQELLSEALTLLFRKRGRNLP